MGYQLKQAGVTVAVVMFDLEVTWPPPKTNSRIGDYEKKHAEAMLLISRGFGKLEFAIKAAMELLERKRNESLIVFTKNLLSFPTLYQSRGGLPFDLFFTMVVTASEAWWSQHRAIARHHKSLATARSVIYTSDGCQKCMMAQPCWCLRQIRRSSQAPRRSTRGSVPQWRFEQVQEATAPDGGGGGTSYCPSWAGEELSSEEL